MSDGFFKLRRQQSAFDPGTCPSGAELEVEHIGTFPIEKVATVGRAPECQVRLDVRSVSRNHARIFFEGAHFWIKDLGSANGTMVNGKKAKLQMIAGGDRIIFGDVAAVFRTGMRVAGPAPVADDPLAGLDIPVPDGTPTGGLGEKVPGRVAADNMKPGAAAAVAGDTTLKAAEGQLQTLTRKIESLQGENERLRREVGQLRTALRDAGTAPGRELESEEVTRLRKLVAQLERALADANVRIRNLQNRPGQSR